MFRFRLVLHWPPPSAAAATGSSSSSSAAAALSLVMWISHEVFITISLCHNADGRTQISTVSLMVFFEAVKRNSGILFEGILVLVKAHGLSVIRYHLAPPLAAAPSIKAACALRGSLLQLALMLRVQGCLLLQPDLVTTLWTETSPCLLDIKYWAVHQGYSNSSLLLLLLFTWLPWPGCHFLFQEYRDTLSFLSHTLDTCPTW